jgi:hypothetical protein
MEMRKTNIQFGVLLLMAGTAAAKCWAQETEQPKDTVQQLQEMVQLKKELKDLRAKKAEPRFYRLNFVIKEVDRSKIINSRTYSILASNGSNSSVRAKEQVQVPLGSGSFQNVDVGANLDTRNIQQVENNLSLIVSADITGLPQESGANTERPVVRHFDWNSEVLIPLNKPTLIFSSDLTTGKTQMQLELTAIPVP